MSTTDQLTKYLLFHSGTTRPPIVCVDGFKLSVQVGWRLYCTPRDDKGPWTAVEVGWPSLPEPLLFDYVESGFGSEWTDSVYPYVPIELVAAVIDCHGGFGPKALQVINSA